MTAEATTEIAVKTGATERRPGLLLQIDRAIGRLNMTTAVAVLTAIAVLGAMAVTAAAWGALYGRPDPRIVALNAILGGIVALPIVYHSQRLIKAVNRKKHELEILTTELRAARDEAEASNRAKTAFFANMSHELRTPLNAVIGFAGLIREQSAGAISPVYVDYAETIGTSGEHLLDLINTVLDLANLDAGRTRFEPEEVDLAEIVSACVVTCGRQARERGVDVWPRIAPDLPRVAGCVRMVHRTILNLLKNAIKFTEAGGSVAIRATVRDGGVALMIVDTGIGMAPEDVAKALQPFYQIDNGLNRKYEGPGLGLPIAKAMTERQAGRLTIESCAGAGTRVEVWLPCWSRA